MQSDDYENFRDALAKLKLNDSALHYEPEVSTALGFGFRIGFLGLLHMDIVQERLEREYNLELITSAPTVVYEILKTDGTTVNVDNPSKLPPSNEIEDLREPIITANISAAAGVRRRGDHAVHGKARPPDQDAVRRQPGLAAIRNAAWPKWCSTSSIA